MSTRRKRRRKKLSTPIVAGRPIGVSTAPQGVGGGGRNGGSSGHSTSSNAGKIASGISQGIAAATGAAISQGVSAAAPYVPTSTSSAAAASPQAAAEKAVKELGYLSSYLKDGKKGKSKSIASSYEKRTEKARKTRQRQEAKVADIGKKIQAKYNTEDSRRRTQGVPGLAATKTGISEGLKALEKTKAPKPRKIAKKLTKAVAKSGPSLDRKFGPDETITQKQAALLAESVGLPGKTYGQIAIGESGIRPAAISSDGGYGLWQMTPRVQSAETKAAWDKIASQHKGGYLNPVANAKMAAYLAGDSTGVSNYYGTGSVTDPDAHLKIGPEGAAKKLAAKPVPKAIKRTARQTLGKKPTKAILAGGKVVKDPKAGEKVSGAVPYSEMKKYIVPTEAKSEIAAEQRAPAKTMLTGMSPELQSALVQLAKNTGIPVRINEGYRTAERANDFPSGTASQHHQGNAADIDNNADYSAEDLAKVGLNNTAVPGEPWHFQPNDPSGNGGTVNTNIPIKGTNLAISLPTPTTTSGGTTATGTTSGVPTTSTTSSGIDPRALTTLKKQSRSGQSVSRTLDKIEARLTTPLTELPEISQELIDAILRKYR